MQRITLLSFAAAALGAAPAGAVPAPGGRAAGGLVAVHEERWRCVPCISPDHLLLLQTTHSSCACVRAWPPSTLKDSLRALPSRAGRTLNTPRGPAWVRRPPRRGAAPPARVCALQARPCLLIWYGCVCVCVGVCAPWRPVCLELSDVCALGAVCVWFPRLPGGMHCVHMHCVHMLHAHGVVCFMLPIPNARGDRFVWRLFGCSCKIKRSILMAGGSSPCVRWRDVMLCLLRGSAPRRHAAVPVCEPRGRESEEAAQRGRRLRGLPPPPPPPAAAACVPACRRPVAAVALCDAWRGRGCPACLLVSNGRLACPAPALSSLAGVHCEGRCVHARILAASSAWWCGALVRELAGA